jgi:hypothetical protein
LVGDTETPTLDYNSVIMKLSLYSSCIILLLTLVGCEKSKITVNERTYGFDADFLRKHTKNCIELNDAAGQAKVLLSADYQGRVMTSSSSGDEGSSYGWINYSLIASGERKKQFNPVGGEERFWLGPEGGQYSLYFHQGDSFLIKNWQVPAVIDAEPFEVAQSSSSSVAFSKKTSITNYSGTVFDLLIERKISLLKEAELESELNTQLPEGVRYVGYQTENQVKNVGSEDWKKESGLISIWLLGMFTPSEETTVIIPFKSAANAKELITTTYFGEIPSERLLIQDSALFFTCDGKYRSKIGLSPGIAKPLSASYDFKKNVLTITRYEITPQSSYVNSNDGPLADGSQLGPFYELESSSPALELKAGESASYKQLTCHLEGDFEKLNHLSKILLGVDLNTLKR